MRQQLMDMGSAASAAAIAAYATARREFLVLCAALAVVAATMLANAPQALAGSGATSGSPDQVQGTLDNAVQWASGIVVSAGVLGLILASLVWIFSGSNERRREKATSWVVGCIAAIAVAFLAPSIVALLQDWTGGGGGGA